MGFFSGVVSKVTSFFKPVVSAVKSAVSAVEKALTTGNPNDVNSAINEIDKAINEIDKAIEELKKEAKKKITTGAEDSGIFPTLEEIKENLNKGMLSGDVTDIIIKDIGGAFEKTGNSLSEIVSDINKGLSDRADKAFDSPYDFANWLTLGMSDGIISGLEERGDKAFNSPYDFANWATCGFVEMADGAVNPKDPLSKDHLLNSFGLATTIIGGVKPSTGGSIKFETGSLLENGEKTALSKSSNMDKLKQTCSNDPINVATGSFYIETTDLVMEDRGLGINIKRSYNSKDTSIGPMGRGWTFEYESRIERKEEENELILLYPDGHFEVFVQEEEQWKNKTAENSANILLDDSETGGFILRLKDKTVYKYDKSGKLINICDKNNNTITIDYDSNNNIKTITSPGQKVLSFKYSYDKITEIVDNIGRKVAYEYYGDNLINVFYPNEGVLNYTYENDLITAITDQDGHTYVRNEYDESARVIKQCDRDGNISYMEYNDMETTFKFEATGLVEKYKYNTQNLVIEQIYNDNTKEIFTYDQYGNKDSETDRNGKVIKRVYDNRCNLLEESRTGGYKVKNQYDNNNNLIKTETSGGTETLYNYDDRGNVLEELVKVSDGVYSRTSYTYDEYGRMLSRTDAEKNTTVFKYGEKHIEKATAIQDPEGNSFKYNYDKAGRMDSISTTYGTVEFGYNALNKKTHIIDAKGNITRLMYDKMGNLIKRVLPNGYNSAIDNGKGYEYRYDFMDRLIRTTDPLANISAVKYDIHGNLIKQINPNYYNRATGDGLGVEYEYDHSNRRIKTIYPTGGISRVKYDAAGNIIKTIDPINYNKEIDDGKSTEYFYDERNRLVTIKDPEGNIFRRFIYDEAGKIIKEIDAKGYLSSDSDETRYGTLYKYNTVGWMLEKRVPVEEESGSIKYNVTLYSYDKVGNRIEEKMSPEYVDENKYPKKWNTITYTYDKNNRIAKIADTTGSEIQYNYDCLGNKTLERARINANTYKVKRYFYNNVGWLEKVSEEINQGDLAEETKGKTTAKTSYEYDGNGNITKVITPEGYENIVKYDAADKLVEIVKRDPKDEESERSTTYEYDSAGNIIKETNCNGYSIIYKYDAMNRQTKIIDKEGGVTRLFYDESGNIIEHIAPENYNVEEDNGKGTSYNYDSMNRLVEVTNALGVIVQKNKYNEVGELIEKLDASKTGVEYSYDIGGRVRHIITPGAKEKRKISQQYQYDAFGNVTAIKDGEGNETSYSLDLWGKVKEVQKADGSREWYDYDYAGNVTTTIDGNGNKTEYTYNNLNLLAQIKDPAGDVMTYQYDKQGRLAKHTDRNKNIIEYLYNQDNNLVSRKDAVTGTSEEYRYNKDGSLAADISGGKVYNYTYTPNMNLKTKAVNGKTVLEYDYNKDGNITALKGITGRKVNYKYDIIGMLKEVWDGNQQAASYTYNPDSTISAIKYGNGINIQYNHDADKNILVILAKTKEGKEILNHRYFYDNNCNQTRKDEGGNATSYAYDALNRLEKVIYPNQITEVFGYDKIGNRVKRTLDSQVTSYSYDERNRLTSLIAGENSTAYKYDAQGNLTSETNKNSTTKYTYDCFNRTTNVQKQDGSYIKNFYNSEGLRSEVDENGVVSKFVFDRGSVVTEVDAEDKLKAANIRGSGLISQRDGEDNSYYYLNNYHGDVVNLTDITGNIVNSYAYDAFGNVLEANEQVHNRFRYSGEQFDSVTNQYYLRARFYNPVVGRFTQEDKYRGDGLNLYIYVANNPVKYVDPSGYCKDSIFGERGSNPLPEGVGAQSNHYIDQDSYTFGTYKGAGKAETYYRTMSQADYDTLVKTEQLPATSETCISPTQGYSSKYDGVLVKFNVKPGTLQFLEDIGVRNDARIAVKKYPNMPNVNTVENWTENNAFFKGEGKKGNKATGIPQVNVGLGTGKALDIFNKNILNFEEVPK